MSLHKQRNIPKRQLEVRLIKNSHATIGASVLTLVLLTLSMFAAVANAQQYESQQTTNFTINSAGVAHIDQSFTGGRISVDIAGDPDVSGSIFTATYSGNPQPNAVVPTNTKLTSFIVITFNMPAANFHGANIVFYYNASSDISQITTPYTLYKYNPDTNTYTALNGIVDSNAQTITASITSPTDPLFAIGGAAAAATATPAPGTPAWVWLAVVLVVIVIVAVVVLSAIMMRRRKKPTFEAIT